MCISQSKVLTHVAEGVSVAGLVSAMGAGAGAGAGAETGAGCL